MGDYVSDRRLGIVRYEDVDREYFEKRKLRKSAGWILLWALGVGAVISGDFAGWNAGLKHGGFGGLAVGTVVMAVMYVCMVFTIAELSAALPHAGGFFSFTRPSVGTVCLPHCRLPSGFIWRSSNCRWRPRKPTTRLATCPKR
jgi:hypothetical protein